MLHLLWSIDDENYISNLLDVKVDLTQEQTQVQMCLKVDRGSALREQSLENNGLLSSALLALALCAELSPDQETWLCIHMPHFLWRYSVQVIWQTRSGCVWWTGPKTRHCISCLFDYFRSPPSFDHSIPFACNQSEREQDHFFLFILQVNCCFLDVAVGIVIQ